MVTLGEDQVVLEVKILDQMDILVVGQVEQVVRISVLMDIQAGDQQ